MTQYWALGLIIVVVIVLYLLRRGHGDARDGDDPVTVPPWEPRPELPPRLLDSLHDPVDLDVDAEAGNVDDTAPAVLSPPEWKPPEEDGTKQRRRSS